MNNPPVLIVPGFQNSGPGHWQSWLESRIACSMRVQQRDWDHALCDEWVKRLDAEVDRAGANAVLVGHSCGTMTIAFWGAVRPRPIAGALLVAPTDTERDDLTPGIEGFAPIPLAKLPFRSILVASRNDPYTSFDRAQQFAQAWGSEFVDIGNAGHISIASGFGPWPAGEQLLQKLF